VTTKDVCHNLWELLQQQGGGCVNKEGREVYPFIDRVDPSSPREVLRPEATEREVRGAVWRLTHKAGLQEVWCYRAADALHIGTPTTTPATSPLEGLNHA